MRLVWPVAASFVLLSILVCAAHEPAPPIKVAIVKNRSEGPAVMEREGLNDAATGQTRRMTAASLPRTGRTRDSVRESIHGRARHR